MTSTCATALGLHVALLLSSGCAFLLPTPRHGGALSPRTASPSSTTCVSGRGGVTSLEASGLESFFSLDSLADLFGGTKEEVTCLPQDPKADTVQRKKELAEKQTDYEWDTTKDPVGTPYLKGFPPDEELPKVGWITQLVASGLRILTGTIRSTVGATEIIEALSSPQRAETFSNRIGELIKDSKVNERPVDIEDYEELHQFPIKTPRSQHDYEDDDAFARSRLQGPNCVVIEKCSQATRDKLKVLDSDPEYKELKDKVDSLMKDGKLLVVDHDLLKDMESDKLDGTIDRFLTPSIALFEVVDDILPIRPIGIQLSQKEATPIFTPDDGYNWMIAKACFESADFIIHEVVSHLGNTHVVLEGPMVAMNRQLPKSHPIHALLKPHLEGTAFINWGAQDLLIRPGNSVDRLQSNKIEDSWDLVLAEVVKRIAKDFTPPEDFKARGVTKGEFSGYYPFRDFSLKYWEATHTWVQEYLNIYYTSEADVEADYELKAFVDEMVDIGQFKWLSEFYTSNDKRGLIAKVLAALIHTGSTYHAAVNFPQKYTMSFVPFVPGSVYVAPPTDKRARTFQDYLNYLPPMEIATSQVSILTLLGDIFYTKLGQYEVNQFQDDRVMTPLQKFQQSIEDIEAELEEQNAQMIAIWSGRGKSTKKALNFRYTTLLPDNIPQSTNI